jgi:uncharacterized protein YecE (DUF72 family)
MIRVGIGGWSFDPWRKTFYPKEVPRARELAYASRALTSIEINGTYYRTQSPKSFRQWHDETPDGFAFSVKASRFATNRRVLGEAGPSIARFLESGLTELKTKLGPLLWQFAPPKKFDEPDFEAFLKVLPKAQDGLRLRHAVEVRHASFCSESFVALARKYEAAIVFADSEKYPPIADVTADFVYARLMRAKAPVKTGYASAELKRWKDYAKTWADGGSPGETLAKAAPKKRRDVFVYMINGAKERAPAAAVALLEQLQ